MGVGLGAGERSTATPRALPARARSCLLLLAPRPLLPAPHPRISFTLQGPQASRLITPLTLASLLRHSPRAPATMDASSPRRRAPVVPPAASFYVPQIPLLPPTSASSPPLTVSAGYLPARPPAAGGQGPAGDAHLYFVLERARHVADRRRLIIWFNGGEKAEYVDGEVQVEADMRCFVLQVLDAPALMAS